MRALSPKLNSSLSDRCPVEIKWAKLLSEKKFDLIQQQHAQLPLREKQRLAHVCSFFCMAHCLSGMTEALEKLFKEDRVRRCLPVFPCTRRQFFKPSASSAKPSAVQVG